LSIQGTTRVQSRLWDIYRRLDPLLLSAPDASLASDDDLALQGRDGRTGLAFGTYTRAGLENALRAYGTLGRLEARGLGPIDVRLDLSDPYRPRIRLESRRFAGRPCLDVELREISGAAVGLLSGHSRLRLLYLEALLLQHPGKVFDWSRPPLPEQEFPGLSLSSEILQILLLLAKRVGAEALVVRPSTFHAAWIYSRYFRFIDGRAQGRFESLRASHRLRPLWLLSWALELGCLTRDGEPVGFAPDPMAAPLTRRVGTHFAGQAWKRAFLRGRAERHGLNLPRLRERFPWSQMPSGNPPASLRKLLRPPSG
jgi:hypothetical protein